MMTIEYDELQKIIKGEVEPHCVPMTIGGKFCGDVMIVGVDTNCNSTHLEFRINGGGTFWMAVEVILGPPPKEPTIRTSNKRPRTW